MVATLSIEIPPNAATAPWVLGLSGGRDSIALLHCITPLAAQRGRPLRAVHVHHGLSPNADAWAHFCHTQCDALGVPLTIERVHVSAKPRQSIEAQARISRYLAFKNTFGADEIGVLAHHADDQIETFLLQLLRGAGPRGLAAMPTFAAARSHRPALWRPWLGVPQSAIAAFVEANHIAHIEDESNADARFKRNALRNDVLPLLAQHFPHYRTGVLRSIGLQQETLTALNAKTAPETQRDRLPISTLREVNFAESIERFRSWLAHVELPLPPATRTREAVNQLLGLANDQRFRLQLAQGWTLRVVDGEVVAEHSTHDIEKLP